jgi:FAD/FMN-containing dehydrogenase
MFRLSRCPACLPRLANLPRPLRLFHSLTTPTEADVAHFRSFLASQSVISTLGTNAAESSDLEQYNSDWMAKYKGQSRVVLKPRSTEQVSRIMKHCWERRIGVVPQGGNTGLVGAFSPAPRAKVLNLVGLQRRKCAC